MAKAKVIRNSKEIKNWVPDLRAMSHGKNTKGFRVWNSNWQDATTSVFTPVAANDYVVCTWTAVSGTTDEGMWVCGSCSGGTTPTPAPPTQDMPEGLQIIIECP